MTKLSNYDDYDYKKEFWVNQNRTYEDRCEKRVVRKLINKINKTNQESLIDIGCGFGRLFPAYQQRFSQIFLMDYSIKMLEAAKEQINQKNQPIFINANAYNIPITNESINVVLSVRTLHHIEKPLEYFKEVNRILTKEGHFILEVPNKRHIVNIIKALLGKKLKPFSKDPLKLSDAFYNFHPSYIKNELLKANLKPITYFSTSYFRNKFIKKMIPVSLLLCLDNLLNVFLNPLKLTPSLFVLCKKTST